MQPLFDIRLRSMRRDRAARSKPDLFLLERAFADCMERIALVEKRFAHGLVIGCPDPYWKRRVPAERVDAADPGPLFAAAAEAQLIVEDSAILPKGAYDLIVAVGTLDTVNDLPGVLRMLRAAMRSDGLFLGAVSGGDSLPRLRAAMLAADRVASGATPHVHPRIEAAAVAPLLEQAGFVRPVVDVDKVQVSYRSFDALVADLRGMAATNILTARSPKGLSRPAIATARKTFRDAGDGERTTEIFEIIHFAAWTVPQG